MDPRPGSGAARTAARARHRLRPLLTPRSRVPHGTLRSPQELADDDWRKTNPRFTEANFAKNLRIVDDVETVAAAVDRTPAQVALAWLLAQGEDIAPIPAPSASSRVEESNAADAIELTTEQIQRLNNLTPAGGERHDEANMAAIDR